MNRPKVVLWFGFCGSGLNLLLCHCDLYIRVCVQVYTLCQVDMNSEKLSPN